MICTHNRARKLANCLAGLFDQSIEPRSYEIIVVDDCSTDATAAVAGRFAVRVIHNERSLGPAASRNVGARIATASIIAFTDDDCVPEPNWLSELIQGFSGSDVVAVGGRIDPVRTDRILLRYYEANNPLAHNPSLETAAGGVRARLVAYMRTSFRLRALPDKQETLLTITSANMAVRRSSFERAGGFDERFRLGGEDDDLSLRLRQFGTEALRYVPRAVVRHDYDPRLRDAFRRNRAYGHAAAISYLTGGGRLPAIFPFPILALGSFALAAINLALLAAPFVLVIVLYPGWIRLAVVRRNPAYVGFAVLQAAFEFQTTIGFLSHVVSERRRLRSRPLGGPGQRGLK